MDLGSILWDDFLTYVGRKERRQGLTEVTSSRFWCQCIKDLHAAANISLGVDINFFVYRELKKYSLHKDQSVFCQIRQLRLDILNEVGLMTQLVSDHMEATNDVPPYRSTLPSPPPKTIDAVTSPKRKTKQIDCKEENI